MAIVQNEESKKLKKLSIKLLKELESKNLLDSITDLNHFYDEPKTFHYQAIVKVYCDYLTSQGYSSLKETIGTGGLSLSSAHNALLRCVGEAIERLSLFCYKKDSIIFSKQKDLDGKTIVISNYTNTPSYQNRTFGWIKGKNLTKNNQSYIPAQLVYLSYSSRKEPNLGSRISTGAASGFTHESVLLRGVYEVIERDTVMTTYLNTIGIPRIDNNTVKNKEFERIVNMLERYNLELFLYDITNDLGIPTFLSLIVDRTGLGPSVCVGPKTSLNRLSAITGSIEEALMARPFVRQKILETQNNIFDIEDEDIQTKEDRLLYWASPDKLPHLGFLLNQPKVPFHNTLSKLSIKDELNTVISKLSKKGFEIFYKDITLDFLKKYDVIVYKVLIPGLQPLYINEKQKEYRVNRLHDVAKYFGKKDNSVNQIPHPFL